MAPQDARAFLEVHHAAVRETAAKDHPPKVIEAWASLPIDEAFVEKVRRNLNGDFRVVAEIGGEMIGMATSCAVQHLASQRVLEKIGLRRGRLRPAALLLNPRVK